MQKRNLIAIIIPTVSIIVGITALYLAISQKGWLWWFISYAGCTMFMCTMLPFYPCAKDPELQEKNL